MRRVLLGVLGVVALVLLVLALFRRTDTTVTEVAEPVAGVRITGDVRDVTVVGSGRPDIALTVREQYTPVRPTVEVDAVGAELRVRGTCPWWAVQCRIDVLVEVPRSVAVEVDAGSVAVRGVDGALRVVTEAGDVDLVDIGGSVTVRSGSGRVALRDLAGDAQVRTGSGPVDATGIRSARLGVEVGSGDVALGHGTPPVDLGVRVGSGDVRIVLPPGSYRIDARSDAGVVSVGVVEDPAAGSVVAVATGAGDVVIEPSGPAG